MNWQPFMNSVYLPDVNCVTVCYVTFVKPIFGLISF